MSWNRNGRKRSVMKSFIKVIWLLSRIYTLLKNSIHTILRGCWEKLIFLWKGVFEKFANFTGKHLCQSFFFNKSFIKKESLEQMFSCEFCQIFKNTFFIEDLSWLLLSLIEFRLNNSGCPMCYLYLYCKLNPQQTLKIAGRVSVLEVLYSKVTGEISAFY